MINLSFKEIDAILGSEERDAIIEKTEKPSEIYYDSRRIKDGKEAIFVAIKTKSQNGHAYIKEAYEKGVRAFIVSEKPAPALAGAIYWQVPNTITALQDLAKASRKKFRGLMVGITGSNGKTIVKEWLYQLLVGSMNVWRSPRSYNSQLGVALSLLKMDLNAAVVFIETGVSKAGEMQNLYEMVLPQMAVFTHFGDAHSSEFENDSEKLREKALLFNNVDVAVLAHSVPKECIAKYREQNPLMKVINWSFTDKASYVVQEQKQTEKGLELHILHKTQTFAFNIPFKDRASVANAMTCLCCLAALEQLAPSTLAKFGQLQSIENRLVSTQGKRNNIIINDSYSNDLSAFEIALDYASAQKNLREKKVLIFSDFDIKEERVLGSIDALKRMLSKHTFDVIIAIGPWLYKHRLEFSHELIFYKNKEEFVLSGKLNSLENSIILIKGARKFALEDVSQLLEREVHQTELRINLVAIKNNVKYYQSLVKPKTKLMGMVKALGYGTGSHEIALALKHAGVQYLGVAFAGEAVEIRKNGIDLPIMVLNARTEEIMAYKHLNLEPVIYSFEQLEVFKRHFRLEDLPVHIELDSGMHRLGFAPEDAYTIAHALPSNFKVKSIFSHLASSEAAQEDAFTKKQTEYLEKFAKEVSENLKYQPLIHIANSAAIKRHSYAHFDMVRLGIGMYGIPSENEPLETAISLVTHITQVKNVRAGEGIGYGRRDAVNYERKIAILPIGYADGLMRNLNSFGKGEVYIKGTRTSILGNICMDMCMIDVTGLDVAVGEEVELFGHHIPVQEVAEKCGTIAYEVLSRISTRVKRVYTEE